MVERPYLPRVAEGPTHLGSNKSGTKGPRNLKISPVACIPHKSKPLRVIVDLSFSFAVKEVHFPSVNDATISLAPAEAMVQLGKSLKRILATIASNYHPRFPFRFTSLYKNKQHVNDTELVVPTSLQMGWSESPTYFCASSETARDVIQALCRQATPLPPHEYEKYMMPSGEEPTPASTVHQHHCVTDLMEVYVDDFIGATNSPSTHHLQHLSRAMLHGIHSVYPPPSASGHKGEDPIANKN